MSVRVTEFDSSRICQMWRPSVVSLKEGRRLGRLPQLLEVVHIMARTPGALHWLVVAEPDYTLAHFQISNPGGVLSERTLGSIDLPPETQGKQARGLILSGKGPVWLYAHLTHLGHAFAWLAVYDPRVGGAVVVSRHRPDAPQVGDVVACQTVLTRLCDSG